MIRRLLVGVVLALSHRRAGLRAAVWRGVRSDQLRAMRVLRYAQLQQQYAQLVTTYQQIRTQYLLLQQQAQLLPVNMTARYRSLASPWLPFTAPAAYGTTTPWIQTANTGQGAAAAYARATQRLQAYAGALARLSAEEAARVRTRYDRVAARRRQRRRTASKPSACLRGHQESMETTVRNLEDDAYATDAGRNTQIAVLNKINATAVTVGPAGQGRQQRAGLRCSSSSCSTRPTDARPPRKASTRTSRS